MVDLETDGGQVHATDFTNASRTLIFDIRQKCWDKELCVILEILPIFYGCQVLGRLLRYCPIDSVDHRSPILGVAGDQQAALFGQTCVKNGELKNTYGTVASL
jgi:glycerol kinase